MTTDAQIAANRANARLSTGPNTLDGKARSSQNARKRRRPGDLPVTLIEDAAAFAAHAEAVARALQPQDAFEGELVRQIALHQWRLGRLQRIEAAFFDAETRRAEYARAVHFDPAALRYGGATPADIWPASVEALSRREAAIERALTRAIVILDRRQAARAKDRIAADKISANEANFPRKINASAS
ncbi:MAG: hypothetical protein ACREFD_04845 [Stellaceae bacterium]